MRSRPTPMKFLALLLVVVLGYAGYRAHMQRLKETKDTAELTAYNQTKSQIEEERAARERRPSMAVAQVLEPLVQRVEAPLNLEEPADFTPVVQQTKQRILSKRLNVEPGQGVVYDRAAAVLNYLAGVADARTTALKSMIRNRSASTALARSDASTFFNQGVAKRWDETLVRARPAVFQLMEQLRVAEREWNKEARQDGRPEEYDLSGLTPVMIPVEPLPDLTKAASTPVARVIRRMGVGGTTGIRTPDGRLPGE
jgi:hypothetical protein